jgi:hypothetical protein
MLSFAIRKAGTTPERMPKTRQISTLTPNTIGLMVRSAWAIQPLVLMKWMMTSVRSRARVPPIKVMKMLSIRNCQSSVRTGAPKAFRMPISEARSRMRLTFTLTRLMAGRPISISIIKPIIL